MKLAIICFARKGSTRLPNKNSMKLRGVPLVWYTLRVMNYVYIKLFLQRIECERILLTDCKICEDLAKKMNIKVIWRNHPPEWDDNRLNIWAHNRIKADNYLLLQATSPFRDTVKILEWTKLCLDNNIQSAFAVKKTDKLKFNRAGSFFFYSKKMLKKVELNNDDSLIFQDNNDIDIDTIENIKEAEKRIDEN
jgi:CMP-N-acetylneuraminic acid synthetase